MIEWGWYSASEFSGEHSWERGVNLSTERDYRMNRKLTLGLIAATTLITSTTYARVKLVALPERARVVVSLTNPDATLVEEERVLTLQKGENHVDFSWRDVNIDATSIQARMLSHPDKVLIINTSYPPNENALVWQIFSPVAQ